jgi:hypothetical protein
MARDKATPVFIETMYHAGPGASPAKVVDRLAEDGEKCSISLVLCGPHSIPWSSATVSLL